MFKYRVLTFTIILSMLLFYVTPFGSVNVKAEEVTYSQSQLQDVGAWFIGERLLEGAIENFDFSNLPTGVTAEDFLADLGAIVVEGNPDPLLDDLGQAADDIWNSIELELNSWSADDGWNFAKDFFYTLWYDVPSSPSLPPLANVFGIAADVLEASGIDKLLQYANTDDLPILPDDYLWFQNVNNIFLGANNFYNIPNTMYDNVSLHSFFGDFLVNEENIHTPNTRSRISFFATDPKVTIYVNFDSSIQKYILTYTSFSYYIYNQFTSQQNQPNYINRFEIYNGNLYVSGVSTSPITIRYEFDDFSTCINWIYRYWGNITLYVNGDLWIGDVEPVNPIASTDLTYPNYEPAKYSYPEDTFVDWNRLYSIIYNAVRDGIVIDFGDLEDCFVDVNGQTAIATLGLVRNDYDNLVDEQFNMVPYPRFNNNLWLTNLADEMTEPAQNGVAIIENAYNIFPLPLQKALLFAGALLLFGLLIRRFIE